MRPLDPRLLRYARSSRSFLAWGAVIGLGSTACIAAFAWLVTALVTGVIDGAPAEEITRELVLLVGVVLARSALSWASEVVAVRGAARAKRELRAGVLDAVDRLGPSWSRRRSTAELTTLLGHGLDALDGYFARYVPQLILTAVAVPLLLIVVYAQDVLSGVILTITLPIIPLFMILIGLATRAVQRRQWDALTRLSSNFLDVIGGLATLKVFGRERRQLARMRSITEEYRAETMTVLRVSFLSGFALELLSSLSVALVAVQIGFRLVDGSIALSVGLFVLLLAPEVFLPVRQVGTNFHAAAEGVEAADRAFVILDEADGLPATSGVAATDRLAGSLVVSDLGVDRGGRTVVSGFSLTAEPGRVVALTGPSGAGKSSVVDALLGHAPHTGTIEIGGVDADTAGERTWLSWAPQRPSLMAGTVAANVALGDPTPDAARVSDALALAAIGDMTPDRVLGVAGAGVSGGQAQRIAVARAYYRTLRLGCAVVVLDEPSSALDTESEVRLALGFRELAERGVAVVVVSHRRALIAAADDVVALGRAEVGAP